MNVIGEILLIASIVLLTLGLMFGSFHFGMIYIIPGTKLIIPDVILFIIGLVELKST